jgi:GT2 family glycosyltransferase
MSKEKEKKPLVSVVIVNYNGKEYVNRCIEAVFKSNYANIEIIVVDNGSKDGSIEILNKYKRKNNNLRLILLDKNYGPSYARNRGVSEAKGDYLAFLDNDTIPDPNWLIPLIDVLLEDVTVGACQCKLLLFGEPKKFDYAGDFLSQVGFLVQKVEGGEIDKGQIDENFEILSAKSAGMVIRKDVFKQIGGFDKDYFIYLEETDLGWRTWLAGYRIIFVPDSVVYHEFGTTNIIDPKSQNYRVKFHGTKNYIMTLIKNLGKINLFKILPKHVLLWIGVVIVLSLKGKFRDSYLVLKGIIWNLLNIFKIRNKRLEIQKKRKISDKDLFSRIMVKKKLSYFINKFRDSHKIGNAGSWS